MIEYTQLTATQLGCAAGLILVNGAVSLALRLGLERTLLIASLRAVLQLILLGWVLDWVFALDRWYTVLALAALMTLIAGSTAASRGENRYPGMWLSTVVSVWASSWLVTGFALLAVVSGVHAWDDPQYLIPLLGMILGNTLNGISIGLNAFTEALVRGRDRIEGQLALGATRWEAARHPMQHAVRTGLRGILNSMMVVGIVSIPGMMTGQLLAGAAPMDAAKYQIAILFCIASATALGTVGVVWLSFRRLFSGDHQLRAGLLTGTGGPPVRKTAR